MRLNRSTLGVLVVSLVVIIAALLLTNNASAPTEDDTTDNDIESLAGPLFTDVVQEDITRFEIRDLETEDFVVMAKDEENIWSIRATNEDEEAEVDQTMVVGSMGNFVTVNASDGFTTEDLEQFGLDEPAYELTAATGEGTTYTLLIGNERSGRFYAQKAGDDTTVYLVPSFTINNLVGMIAEPPYVVEQTTTASAPIVPGPAFPGLTAQVISAVGVTNNSTESTTQIGRDEFNFWFVEEATNPLEGLDLDQTGLTELFGQLIALQTVTSFPSEGQDLAELGLEEPAYTITIDTLTGASFQLDLGNQTPNGDYYALANGDTETVYQVTGANLDVVLPLAEQPLYILPEATAEATVEPGAESTAEATSEPGVEATDEPTPDPTEEPTSEATDEPAEATADPLDQPGNDEAETTATPDPLDQSTESDD